MILLCQELIKRHNIPQHLILGHSDIAPTRKQDPGEFFNWQRLAQHNIGLWTEDFLPAQRPVSQMLEEIGYDALDLKAALIAFQRRFYPQALLNNGSKTFERLSSVSALYQKYKQTRHDI